MIAQHLKNYESWDIDGFSAFSKPSKIKNSYYLTRKIGRNIEKRVDRQSDKIS
jgi:hypothetical protein